ncbi:hypothetical protein [Streptomyces sp. NBC_01565]|uniref:hypothetical protein n=1 Tax=unclassified Streptomyces TaxID=2593676 RepID=UPI002253F7A1|nr:hypothetical protein [Streptomyces sp. NBC_01565]MCX4546246.1 hypothetical protein [Streptomyces sp. NBC_01565]
MSPTRHAGTALAALAAGAALLLTGCGGGADAHPKAEQSAGADGKSAEDMLAKLDAADSAASQADADASQNN